MDELVSFAVAFLLFEGEETESPVNSESSTVSFDRFISFSGWEGGSMVYQCGGLSVGREYGLSLGVMVISGRELSLISGELWLIERGCGLL